MEEMRIWKVWAQCVRRPAGKGVEEINEGKLITEIGNLITEAFNNGMISYPEDAEDEAMDELDSKCFDFLWEKKMRGEMIEGGDFNIVFDVERPERPNMCSFEDFREVL